MHVDTFQTLTFFSCNLECRHYKCTKQHNNRRSSAVGNSHYLDMNRLFSDDLMIMTINIYILHIYLQWCWCRYSLKSANWNSSVFVYNLDVNVLSAMHICIIAWWWVVTLQAHQTLYYALDSMINSVSDHLWITDQFLLWTCLYFPLFPVIESSASKSWSQSIFKPLLWFH